MENPVRPWSEHSVSPEKVVVALMHQRTTGLIRSRIQDLSSYFCGMVVIFFIFFEGMNRDRGMH